MKVNHKLMSVSTHIVSSIVLLSAIALAPGLSFARDKDAHEDYTELRIKDMRSQLKITSTQEELWAKVAQVMLDDAKSMDALTQARFDHSNDMSAIDDLKSYSEIADAHANGIKNLIPVFSELYASMSEAQQKAADALFRNPTHTQKHKKSVKK